MAFVPFWSCSFGPFNRHSSNAEAENNFFQMKFCQSVGRKLTEAAFLKERYEAIKDEIEILVSNIIVNVSEK